MQAVCVCDHVSSPHTVEPGELAVVGIGNPLLTEDASGIELISALSEYPQFDGRRLCCINLEIRHCHLPEILDYHRTVVVVDAIELADASAERFHLIELTDQVLRGGRQMVSSSHGLSWLDELRLHRRAERQAAAYLLGVNGGIEIDGASGTALRRIGRATMEEFIDVIESAGICLAGSQ